MSLTTREADQRLVLTIRSASHEPSYKLRPTHKHQAANMIRHRFPLFLDRISCLPHPT